MTDRCEGDYFRHNHWVKCYPSMGYPDEEGQWNNDNDWIRKWVEQHTSKLRPLKLTKDGFTIYKKNPFMKILCGYKHLNENEGYFYLQSSKDDAWIIEVDDVFETYQKIMKYQDEILGMDK